MSRYRNVLIVASLVLLGIGIGFSYRDYRAWKYEETKNYGYGPGGLYTPAIEMKNHYENDLVRLKFNYPNDWKAVKNPKFEVIDPKTNLKRILGLNVKEEVVRFETGNEFGEVRLSVSNSSIRNLVDYVDKEIANRVRLGETLVGEREYVNSDRIGWTLISFTKDEMSIKRAYTIVNDLVFIVEFVYEPSNEMKVIRTYEELLRNMISI